MRIADLPKYELQPDEIQKVEEIIDKYRDKKGALIPILQKIQKVVGFLPIEVQKKVANTEIVRVLIKLLMDLDVDLAGIKSEEELESRLKDAARRYK